MFGRARRPATPPVRLRIHKVSEPGWPWAWTVTHGRQWIAGDTASTHAEALAVGLAALEHATLRRTA